VPLLKLRSVRNAAVRLGSLALSLTAAACHQTPQTQSPKAAQAQIQARIDASLDATRAENIDRYMSFIPQDWALHDASGAIVRRDDLRRSVLEQWSIIDKTISLQVHIDRLELHESNATAWTSQRWERLMHERTGPALDDVVTTEKHEEHWHFTGGQWWCYEVKELGGEIFVNGKPYHE
jgi:ketosteroid isomerase-like protein